MVPFVPDVVPDLKGTQALLAAGRHDQIVPQTDTVKLSRILQTAGAAVSFHRHEGGHELGEDDVEAAQRWLAGLSNIIENDENRSIDCLTSEKVRGTT